jgi:hypothetical protein
LPFGGIAVKLFRNHPLLNSRDSYQFRKELEMKRLILIPLFLVIVLAMVNPCVYAMEIKYVFVFADRFPNEAEPLGFTPGNVLQIGAFITSAASPITEVTAKNLDTGLVLKLAQLNVGTIYKDLLYEFKPYPAIDPSKHFGVWEIRVKDKKGNEIVATTHKLDKVGEMPYVSNIKASGNPLAPMITWSTPEKDYPPECKIKYTVRLLKNNRTQFYKSKKGFTETKEQIPEGFLKAEDIPDAYVRIECQCWDTADKDQPAPMELRSETFRPLQEALGQ